MEKMITKVTKTALAALMGISLVGCSSSTSSSTAAASEDGAVTYKDNFVYAIGGEPTYMCPGYVSDTVTGLLIQQIYYPLFYGDEDGNLINAACTDYEFDEDTMTYTFHIRDDLKWSDGEDCTAEDYVYGMKHSLSLGAADSYYSYYLYDYVVGAKEYSDNMTKPADQTDLGIKVVDDTTFTIQLKTQCPYFVSLLTMPVFLPIRADYCEGGEGDYTWADDASIPTNGPYHPTSIDKATEIVMEKNEYFPDADQVVTPTLTAVVMADMDAQLLAFQTGEIDFATGVDTSVAKTYEDSDELVLGTDVTSYFVLLNSFGDCEALHDVNVRKALQLGVDRSAIVTALDVPGVYTELYGLVPEGIATDSGDFRTEGDADGYYCATDKEKAKELLAEAGYTEDNPLQLEYYYNQNSMHDTVAAVLREQWAEINVELTLRTGEIRTFFSDRSNGLFETCRHAFSADYLDPSTLLDIPVTTGQTVITWGDETYDEMIFESRELSGSERTAKLHEAEKYLVEEQAYCVPLFGYRTVMLARSGISGNINNTRFWFVKVPE